MPGEMPDAVADLFGVGHQQLISLAGRKPHPSQSAFVSKDVAPMLLRGVGYYNAALVKPSFYLQYLKPKNATPALMYREEVVGAVNHFGSGRAVLIGTLAGSAVFDGDGAENQAFLKTLLADTGVRADRAGKLTRRRRSIGSKSAWFLFNATRETVEEEIAVPGYRSVEDLLQGALQMRDNRVIVRVGPMDIACLILRS